MWSGSATKSTVCWAWCSLNSFGFHHEDGGQRTNVHRVQTVLTEALVRVQNELFDLGAELACPPATLPEYMVLISQRKPTS